MIQSATLLILLVAVTIRAKRSWKRPAWWATVFGMFSLATYGVVFAGPPVLDGLLGGRNLLTLVRDAAGLAAMWAFHNAVAVQRGHRERVLPWWTICAGIAAFAVPFLLVDDPGQTSPAFVLDRLEQTPVWLFATIYTVLMGLVSALTLTMLAEDRTVPTVLWVSGLSLMFVSDVLEVGYLAIAHFAPVGEGWRTQFYNIAEFPFFLGVSVAVFGFIWIAGPLGFWWAISRWTLRVDARVQGAGYRHEILSLARARQWTNRQIALESAVNIRDRLQIESQALSSVDHFLFAIVEQALSRKTREATV